MLTRPVPVAAPAPISAEAIPSALYPAIAAIAGVARDLSAVIARGPLGAALGAEIGTNTDNDNQKTLDMMANETFATALTSTEVRWYTSKERDSVNEIDAGGTLALAIDPLDGSSNIDVNVSIGTIFSILPAEDDPKASFLRRGSDQIAAGYVIYGPQTAMVVSFGDGVRLYILDRDSGAFVLAAEKIGIVRSSREFAINASNYRHWLKPVRAYVDDCLSGTEGPRRANYNMRWIASLVAETHRILTRGGVFLYPADAREGYARGRLRMVYECAPIAFLITQAGGGATDGCDPILTRIPESLHARTPFVFGSAENVEQVSVYHDLPEQEISALFGTRGLFRA